MNCHVINCQLLIYYSISLKHYINDQIVTLLFWGDMFLLCYNDFHMVLICLILMLNCNINSVNICVPLCAVCCVVACTMYMPGDVFPEPTNVIDCVILCEFGYCQWFDISGIPILKSQATAFMQCKNHYNTIAYTTCVVLNLHLDSTAQQEHGHLQASMLCFVYFSQRMIISCLRYLARVLLEKYSWVERLPLESFMLLRYWRSQSS